MHALRRSIDHGVPWRSSRRPPWPAFSSPSRRSLQSFKLLASLRCSSTTSKSPHSPRTALFFPGQGVQRVGMATPWLNAFPKTCKPFLEEMDSILHLQTPLSTIISDGPNSALTATENSQPAIMATSIMILRVLEQDFNFDTASRVDVVLGHSLGEFAALVAGGYLTYPTALRIIRRRAEAMARCSREASKAGGGGEYGMMALVCEPDRLTSLIETIEEFLGYSPMPAAGSDHDEMNETPVIQQVLIANINSKNQIVLSGAIERIKALLVQLRQFGGHDPRAVRLSSDSPFHSPIMIPAKTTMMNLLADTEVQYPARFPCISNVTGRPFESADRVKELLARQCVETVRWWDSIKFVDQEMGVRRWIGIGPGKVGRNLVGKEVGMRGQDLVRGGGVWGVTRPEDVEVLMKGLEETEKLLEEGEE